MNVILLVGSILGFISIAMAAYLEHGLKLTISTELYHMMMMAVRSNQLQAILITSIGLCLLAPIKAVCAKRLAKAAWVFVISTIFFSYSIYLSVLTGYTYLAKIAPIGGGLAMIAWLLVAWAACAREKSTENKDYFYFRKPTK